MYILMFSLIIATLLVLLSGVGMMAFTNQAVNKKYATKMMLLRIFLQFTAIITLASIYLLS